MKKTLLMFMLGFSMMAAAQSCSNKPCCANKNNATCQNASASISNAEQVEIIYFHGKQRCPTCLAIESETKALMEEDLAPQVEANNVKMSIVDFSTDEGKEIAKKYKVSFSSLILVANPGKNETMENLTNFAFANARSNATEFKKVVRDKVLAAIK